MENKHYTPEDTIGMLKKANLKTLRNFIAERVKTDMSLCQALGGYLDKPSTKQFNAKDFEDKIIKSWKRAFEEAQYNWRYYDLWDHDLIEKLQKILKRIVKESQSAELSISLQLKLLDNSKIRNGSKWEIFGKILETIILDFRKIFKTHNEAEGHPVVRKYLFDACFKYLRKFKVLTNDLDHRRKLESFVIETFQKEFPGQIKDYINMRIQSLLSSEDDSGDKDYDINYYVERMLVLLSRNNATEEELLNCANEYWETEKVRRWFISYYKNTSQWAKAIEVLEECVTIEKNQQTGSSDYKKELKELYRQTGDKAKYREILLEEIEEFKGEIQTEMAMYRKLKSLYTPEEWARVRELLIALKAGNYEIVVQYFLEDKLYQRLSRLLLADDTNYVFFDKHVILLPSEYTEKILTKYEKHFEKMLLKAQGRLKYQELMNTLKDAHKIAGGKELTDSLTTEWLNRYGTRPTLCEEIRKFQSESKSTD